MQYQKEEMRAAIIEAAVEEFYLKGYEKASMRQICKRAGTSIGNMYRYFLSREALFENAVGETYRQLLYIIKDHIYTKGEKYDIREIADYIGRMLFRNFGADAKRLLILFDCSAGSPYSGVKAEISEIMSVRVRKEVFGGRSSKTIDFGCSMLACGVLESILSILRQDFSREESSELLEKVLSFYFDNLDSRLNG